MRAGIIVSILGHGLLLFGTLVWLANAKPFETVPAETIAVELVTPDEIAPAQPDKPEAKDEFKITPVPDITIGQTERAASPPRSAPSAAPEQAQKAVVEPPSDQPKKSAEEQRATEQRAVERPAPQEPTSEPRADPAQPAAPSPSAVQPPAPSKVFDVANIPALLDMVPQATAPAIIAGFDALAEVTADLPPETLAALKARVRQCWRKPAGVDEAKRTQVVMRVFLQPNGALAAEPMLIAAPASREGPALVAAATRAINECQPFGFLPPERYNEWKVLDLPITARDMAGG